MVDAQHDRALVPDRGDGPQGRPSRAGHRQGRRRDADDHPRGIRQRPHPPRPRHRRPAWRHHQTQERRAATTARRCSPRAWSSSCDPSDLAVFGELERDEHDHVRLGEVHLGDVIKMRLRQRLTELGLDASVVSKDIGYELRCADPIPYDMEYTRDLGYCAAQYLLDGGTDAMVMLVDGRFRPQPFSEMLDPRTGRTRVRLVDVASEQYQIARRLYGAAAARRLRGSRTRWRRWQARSS